MERIVLNKPGIARNGLLMARAISHPIRDKIINLLHEFGPQTVTSIYTHHSFRDKTGKYLEQSQCSQHLKTLREANLVKGERSGKEIIYSLTPEFYRANDLLNQMARLYQKRT